MLNTFFKNLLFKWMIFYRGVRFYETTVIPKSPNFKLAKFEIIHGHEIEFYFYREDCVDVIHRRGRIVREYFTGYTIQARFDESLPFKKTAFRFNNMKFFFNTRELPQIDEESVVNYLLDVYFDYIKSEIKV